MRSTWVRRVARGLAAALVGAAGLGGEGLLLTAVGLVVGQARAAAFGLAVWLAAWALGAYLAGRGRLPPARALTLWGGLAALGAPLALAAALALADSGLGPVPAVAAGASLLALAALPQGAFLPLLARAGRLQDVSWLFAANLAGAVLGARLLAFDLPAAVGFGPAGWAVGGLALVATVLARVGVEPGLATPIEAGSARPGGPVRDGRRLRAGIVVGLVTAWLAGVEWVGFRLGALWLGGMQPAVTAVLAASLLSLAAGAALLPRLLPRGPLGAPLALALAAVGSWALVRLDLPRTLLDVPAREAPLRTALALVAPVLVPLGAVVPLLHRRLAGETGARLGGLLLHETWGALLGVPLAHLVLVPVLGLGGAIAVLSALLVPAVLLLDLPRPSRVGFGVAGLVLALLIGRSPEPALSTPALDRPEFEILSFEEDAHFAVTVIQDGLRGERTLLTDDFRATAVGDDYMYMRVLGHLPVLLHRDPGRVAVMAFGTGTTAGAVARHPQVERIEVLEISRAVLDAAPYFHVVNHRVLGDERTRVHLGDGRRTLQRFDGVLDVLTMEPLLPDSPFAVHLYTPGFYRLARRSLAPGGLVCQWVPPQALEPDTFDAVVGAFTGAFPWSGVFLFGNQLILIGGEAAPGLDPARFEHGGELGRALAALGLERPSGAAARFVTTGASWPRPARLLTDADPWVIYRPRRRGTVQLADLPRNLARLRELEAELPAAWQLVVGVEGRERLGRVRLLHRAREAWHREEYERRRSRLDPSIRPPALPRTPELGHLEGYLSELADSRDPEVVLLRQEIEFVRAYRRGVEALALGDTAEAWEALREAARIRPDRAAIHLHAALAAWRGGRRDVAHHLAKEAFGLCPRLLETGPGRRVLALGLPASLTPRK